MLPSFHTLERQHINDNVLRVVHALENEEHHLSLITNDWSSWDDTYNYIVDRNSDYETSNLVDSTFAINQLNMLYLLDNAGQKVWGKAFAEDFETPLEIQPFDQERFSAEFPLIKFNSAQTPLNDQHVSGLLMTSAGPMFCASRPILDSNDNGPSRGTLIMGRLLSQELIQRVSRLTNIDYEVQVVARDRTDDGSGELSTGANSENITYQIQDNILMATKIYTDIVDNPAIRITVFEQREILEQGHKALRVAVILMAVGVTSALALLLLMLQKSVIAPVNLLTRDILARRQSKQAWEPLRMGSCASQEICLFTDEFNQLMGSLDSKNTQLAEVNFSLMGEAKKLKEAQGILKTLDQLKSEFISTAAHELRTPVASIMGFTDLLSDPETIASFSEVQKQDFLQEIYDSCERLSKNVDDILDVSRIEAGSSIPLDKQSISTEILLSKTVNHFKLKAKHQITLELKSSTPENMVVDVHRISQVMENLLSNAIKYSPKRSRISIVAERDGRYCKVTVIDQGVGMTEEQVARVFDKFYRVDSSDTAVRGLGLGMSIVKQIIEDHGGTIWVDSLLGEGSSVYFTLPIASLEEGN